VRGQADRKLKYALCRQASDLCVKPMPCFAYGLGNLELTLLIVADAANANFSAEIPEHAVISLADNGLEGFDLFAQLIMTDSGSVDLRCQCIQLVSNVLQLLEDASPT